MSNFRGVQCRSRRELRRCHRATAQADGSGSGLNLVAVLARINAVFLAANNPHPQEDPRKENLSDRSTALPTARIDPPGSPPGGNSDPGQVSALAYSRSS